MVLTKQELIGCLQKEVRILVHLCGKLKPEMLDYRPTGKQRSTIELLRYLTIMGPVLVPSIRQGAFLEQEWVAGQAKADAMDFGAIVKSLESQAAFYADAINAFSDDELRGEIAPCTAPAPCRRSPRSCASWETSTRRPSRRAARPSSRST